MNRMLRWKADALCIALLCVVWLVFFWRLFTPVAGHQAALVPGDFSDQFVTFGAYQYTRFAAGEVPLWNPYNNGGMPFIADTQAAVFYPPRLLTIALSSLSGGWTYHALELEMTFHVLFYTLTMYALVRHMTAGKTGSCCGAVTAALVAGYGGYLTGYPPLQLALLEAGVWLPLAILGIYLGFGVDNAALTVPGERVRRLLVYASLLAGFALGMSWMAGHPQTSFFLTYLSVAYLAYCVWRAQLPIWHWLGGLALMGVTAAGLVAVTLLPGLEYLLQTSRAGFSYDELSHGLPLRDLLQILIPGVVSQWSPLWIGLVGLALALLAVYHGRGQAAFWAGVAVFSLLFSLGGNGPLYPVLFDIVPGLRYFRGQERGAYLYANGMAILAGIGAAYFLSRRSAPSWRIVIVGLVLTELGIAAALTGTNYIQQSPETLINRNPLIDAVRADANVPFRVDGRRVLGGNWGSYYRIADIQGISPLFLAGPQDIIEAGLPDERAWELFAVRYVYSDWEALPVPGEVIAEGSDSAGPVKLHRLTAERPFAHFVYDAVVVESDAEARALLADPQFNPRTTVILHAPAPVDLPMSPIEHYSSTVTYYSPERVVIVAETPDNAILSLAQVDYPGWRATVDGTPSPLLRAYGGLSALAVRAGRHTIELIYDPAPYRAGSLISAAAWIIILVAAIRYMVTRSRRVRI